MMTILQITAGKELLDNGGAGKRPVITLTIRGEDEHTSIGALAMQLIALIHGANGADLAAKHPEEAPYISPAASVFQHEHMNKAQEDMAAAWAAGKIREWAAPPVQPPTAPAPKHDTAHATKLP